MSHNLEEAGIEAIASAVRSGAATALDITRAALARIRSQDGDLNCFTAVLADRACAEAAEVDRKISQGEEAGPLAGVPFAVKNLFDIQGIPTLAGSIIRARAPAPQRDAASIAALNRAGAVLVGALNMDEFAYGFTTENTHYGVTRNPHDLTRVAGGSSGGSAAAVAAGLVPLTLGSDTNGSIRVPASFCGIFGLKPTYGRLSRRGAFPFVNSLDHVGPFARSAEDLAAVYDVLQGADPGDPVCTTRPAEACLPDLRRGTEGLRIAVAGGYFADRDAAQANEAVAAVARALRVDSSSTHPEIALPEIELPEVARARAAAYIITASEGGNHHLADLRSQADRFDPNTRSRFLAGTLIPAAWVNFAQRFRSWYREELHRVFEQVDVILAPATPCPAIRIGQQTMMFNGQEVPSRANIGVFTQPISFVGLPVVTVPVHMPGQLPIGVQLIGAPYQEAKLLRVAWQLQSAGVVAAPIAQLAGAAR
jgi:aspartyl-tRNA(Asn)/glutamyl-tRNA(Gln) amidotransferase subunit A